MRDRVNYINIMPTALFTGLTGFLGGALLPKFQEHFPEYKITALVRNPAKFAKIEALGVTPIQGSLADVEITEKAASEADLVVDLAQAGNVENVKAIIRGLTKRSKVPGVSKPLLIHTSGGFTYAGKDASGTDENVRLWDDNDKDDIATVDINNGHRKAEAEVVNADLAGDISAYTIVPPLIYGISSAGPAFNTVSQVWGLYLPGIIKSRQVVTINEGRNRWSTAHVQDLVELYILVIKLALSGKDTESGYGKTYFGTTKGQTIRWGEANTRAAVFLHSKGLVDSPTPIVQTPEQAPHIAPFFGVNGTFIGNRSAGLGWKQGRPQILEDSDAFEKELELTLKNLGVL